jgi:predicted ATP-grasp superfamily ATP-dependent carboligase
VLGVIVLLESLTFGLRRLADAVQSRGLDLVLVTRDPGYYWYELERLGEAAHRRRLDVRVCDTFDSSAVRHVLEDIADLRGLIANTDTWGVVGAQVARDLGLPHSDPEHLGRVRDKTWVRNRLHEAGLSAGSAVSIELQAVSAATLDTARASIGVPRLIVKDTSGTGSENVWLLDTGNAEEVAAQILVGSLRAGTVTCEPYFAGPLFSFESLSFRGAHRLLAVSGRVTSGFPGLREDAILTPVSTGGALSDIEPWSGKVLDAVGYGTGLTHTEFVLTGEGPEVVEVNPRLGGVTIGEALCRAFDLNVYDALVDLALGDRPTLLDEPLTTRTCTAQALVYPEAAGRLVAVRDRLDGQPLPADAWFPVKRPGAQLPPPTDQRASVGTLLADDPAGDIALLELLATLNRVEVVTSQ